MVVYHLYSRQFVSNNLIHESVICVWKMWVTQYCSQNTRISKTAVGIHGSDNGMLWLKNKIQWYINRNSYIFIHEYVFGNVVWKMATVSSRPQCVNEINQEITTTIATMIIMSMVWAHSRVLINKNIIRMFFLTYIDPQCQIKPGILHR